MHSIGNWLRQIGMKLTAAIRQFMVSRYGTDKLNTAILGAGVIACLISMFVKAPLADLILTVIAYILMIWAIFRTFSRKTYKRYRENRWFLMQLNRLKDRKHRYFTCPKCRQSVRVPRGKGKIMITCPKCKEKFSAKS